MKRILITVLALTAALLIASTSLTYATIDCGQWNDIIGQEYSFDLGGQEFRVVFQDPLFGPCPVGPAFFWWEIDGQIETLTLPYETDYEGLLYVAGVRFLPVAGSLLLIPEGFTFFWLTPTIN